MTMLTGFPTHWNGVSVIVRQSCSCSLWAAGFQTGLYRCPFFWAFIFSVNEQAVFMQKHLRVVSCSRLLVHSSYSDLQFLFVEKQSNWGSALFLLHLFLAVPHLTIRICTCPRLNWKPPEKLQDGTRSFLTRHFWLRIYVALMILRQVLLLHLATQRCCCF